MGETVYLGTTDGLFIFDVEGYIARRREQAMHGRQITALAGKGDHLLAAIYALGVCRVERRTHAFEWCLDADVLVLAQHPSRPELCVAGTEPASLFRTDDGGVNWRELKSLREVSDAARWYHPSPSAAPHVKWIAFDPVDPDTFYAGIEIGGVYRTRDGGVTFERASGGLYDDVHGLAAHPRRREVLYAVTGQGIYVTTDSASTWRPANRGLTRRYVTAVAVVAEPVERVVAGASHGPPWNASHSANAMIFRCNPPSDAWEVAMDGIPMTLDGAPIGFAASRAHPGRLYGGVASGELLVSDGKHWTLLAGDLPPIQAILCA
ncbi:MAG: hypothetical protein HY261_09485 [Chloroflexi bacterium]|nr:hypothetical protein [Chloroflexota bacterium]